MIMIGATPFTARSLRPLPVLTAVAINATMAVLLNHLLFGSRWLRAVLAVGHGFVSGTLVANLLLLLVVVWLCLGRWAGASLADLGLHRRSLAPAALSTVSLWLALHAAAALLATVHGDVPAAAAALASPEQLRALFGSLLGQLLGNALYEEILFRGCLLVQFAHWLTPPGRAVNRRAWAGALFCSQALFAVQHVPHRLAFGAWDGAAAAAADLAGLFVSGVLLAVLYLRTHNLLLVVGLHALGNAPTLLLAAPPWLPAAALAAGALACFALGPRLSGAAPLTQLAARSR